MLGARMLGGFNVIRMIFKALEAPSALQRFILPPAVALPFAARPPAIYSLVVRDPILDHGPEGQIAIKQL